MMIWISKVDNGESNNCNGDAQHRAFLTWNRLEKTCSGDVGRRVETCRDVMRRRKVHCVGEVEKSNALTRI